jgi:hypothetical protein
VAGDIHLAVYAPAGETRVLPMQETDLLANTQQPRGCKLVQRTPWPYSNSSLIAHVSVSFPRKAGGSISVGVPDIPEIDVSGHVQVGEDGKRKYHTLLQFETNEPRERWHRAGQGAVVAAGIRGAP